MAYTYPQSTAILARVLELLFFVISKILGLEKASDNLRDYYKDIVIIEPFQMGDVVSLSVMFSPLLKKYPDASLTVLTGMQNENVKDFDDRITLMTTYFPWSNYKSSLKVVNKWLKLIKDLRKIRGMHFDLGIDPRGDIRSQIILSLMGCKQRVGYTNYMNSNINIQGLLLTNKTNNTTLQHRYERNLNLLSLVGISDVFPIRFPSLINQIPRLIESKIKTPFIIIHPGAGWFHRRWSTEKWVNLALELKRKYEVRISFIGAKSEKPILDEISGMLNDKEIEYKITNFRELIRYLKSCNLYIGLDSGPMNLAVCLGKPVLALFGPGDSEMWKPYTQGSFYVHKKAEFPCNPCLQKMCYFPERNCMSVIEVEDVMRHVEKYLNN